MSPFVQDVVGQGGPDGHPAGRTPSPAVGGWRRRWALVRRFAPWGLGMLVLGLLASQARLIDWPAVGRALAELPAATLALALALTLVSYTACASFDLVGRHTTAHPVPRRRTLGIAATCYAFNLNFGSLVGALALKLRLYDRAGLDAGTTARVIGLSVITNWLGYLALGGAVLVWAPPPLPAELPIGAGVPVLGAVMLGAAGLYLLLCATGPPAGRSLGWRRHRLHLPGGRVALGQLALAAGNWALMGVIVWVLLGQPVNYFTVLGVLLLAAIAGVVTHVPAGLGVIEAVFIACLGGQVQPAALLAGLLAYRAAYYLVPLVPATLSYALSGQSRGAPQAAAGADPGA